MAIEGVTGTEADLELDKGLRKTEFEVDRVTLLP